MQYRDEPLAYFITWTVYGTFLHGDRRWWRQEGESRAPQPRLERWHRDRLEHDVVLLAQNHRDIVHDKVIEHCSFRQWKPWVVNARSNHVHVVASCPKYMGTKVRDQLKANATRGLRQHDPMFKDRPIWTTKGDVQLVWDEDSLERIMDYASEAQDQMDRGKH